MRFNHVISPDIDIMHCLFNATKKVKIRVNRIRLAYFFVYEIDINQNKQKNG